MATSSFYLERWLYSNGSNSLQSIVLHNENDFNMDICEMQYYVIDVQTGLNHTEYMMRIS